MAELNVQCPMRQNVPMDLAESVNMDEDFRQFNVIDEVHGDGSGTEIDENGNVSSDTDLGDNELEDMLNEGLPDDIKNRKTELQYDEKFKTVLEEKGQNHFEVLPEGWVQVTHNSGIPLFLHTSARVCTVSRPYFLGPGSVRKHEIPISAIPCLSYRKALEKEELLGDSLKNEASQRLETPSAETEANEAQPMIIATKAVIETAKENLKNESLTPQQVTDYCRKLFRFKEIRVMRFKSWLARRKFTKSRKHIQNLQRPTLPDGTKLISFPIQNVDQSNSRQRREWIMNPNGKSYVCVLHEYVQHALKKQPTYEFKELENVATPYSATVSISDLKYGTGFGTSKKQAKSDAARETLEILIPHMRDRITAEKNKTDAKNESCKSYSVFDEIRIEDPRVAEFCAKTTEPLPHSVLMTCLQRNYGLGDMNIDYQVNTTKHKKNEFTMTVGKHTVTINCKNKREGKHRASQAILKILHPHIETWGSLLRLYGNHTVKSFKEKKQEEQEITVLQSRAAMNQPNYAILDKLKLEMTKLMDKKAAVKSIGVFRPPIDVDLPRASGSNLNNVELV